MYRVRLCKLPSTTNQAPRSIPCSRDSPSHACFGLVVRLAWRTGRPWHPTPWRSCAPWGSMVVGVVRKPTSPCRYIWAVEWRGYCVSRTGYDEKQSWWCLRRTDHDSRSARTRRSRDLGRRDACLQRGFWESTGGREESMARIGTR